jgi:hypothetical protein
MADDPLRAQGELNQQFDHDERMRAIERAHNLILHGAKGLGVLNAGAAIAMLAFAQALIGKATLPAVKGYLLLALSLFIVGAFLASIVFFFHYKLVDRAFQEHSRKMRLLRVIWGLLVVSAACALFGGIIITTGVSVAF